MAIKAYLDPGHGGSDPGAVKYLIERDVNLVEALACRDFLLATGQFEVKMSRTDNATDTSINAMAKEANAWGADVVLSIHNNAGGGDGFEAYHSILSTSKGKAIAAKIEAQVKTFGQNSRGLKTRSDGGGDYYGMIRLPEAPAIILEGGFVDNATDVLAFDEISEQQGMGVAYAKGLCDYFGVAYDGVKPSVTPTPAPVVKPVAAVKVATGLTLLQKQRNLQYIGYYYRGAIDNIAGPLYKQGVGDFQEAYGLVVDRICGPKTTAKLIEVTCQVQKIVGTAADGIVGPNTISCIKKYQRNNGLRADGIAGPLTMTKMGIYKTAKRTLAFTESKYFNRSEFACECNGKWCNGYNGTDVSPKLLWILEQLRKEFGQCTITSGIRCKRLNAQVGGISGSCHITGKAADFYIPGICDTAAGRKKVVARAYELGATYSYANTAGMGNAVHVNV